MTSALCALSRASVSGVSADFGPRYFRAPPSTYSWTPFVARASTSSSGSQRPLHLFFFFFFFRARCVGCVITANAANTANVFQS